MASQAIQQQPPPPPEKSTADLVILPPPPPPDSWVPPPQLVTPQTSTSSKFGQIQVTDAPPPDYIPPSKPNGSTASVGSDSSSGGLTPSSSVKPRSIQSQRPTTPPSFVEDPVDLPLTNGVHGDEPSSQSLPPPPPPPDGPVDDTSRPPPPPPPNDWIPQSISQPPPRPPPIDHTYYPNYDYKIPFVDTGSISEYTADGLDNSGFETIPDNVPEVPRAAGYFIPYRYLSKLQKTMQMRRDAIKDRNKLELRRRNYVNELRHNASAREDLIQLGDVLMAELQTLTTGGESSLEEVQVAWGMFQDVAAKLSKRAKAIQKLAKEISQVDKDLIRQDNKLYFREEHFLKEVVENPDAQSMTTPDDYSDIVSDDGGTIYAKSGSSVITDPLEHDYYNAIGDVTLAREHLYNFETEHTQELFLRHGQHEMGEEPEVPEDEFWKEYFETRRKYIDDYVNGKADVERLYKQCRNEDAKVDPPNLPPLDPQVLDQLRDGKLFNAPFAPPSEAEADADAGVEKTTTMLRKLVEADRLLPHQPFYARHAAQTNRFRVVKWMGSMPEDTFDNQTPSSVFSANSQIRLPAKYGASEEEDVIFDKFSGERATRRYSDPAMMAERMDTIWQLRRAKQPRRNSVHAKIE